MKRILFVLLLFSTIAQAQTPSGYTRVNQKYEWYGGKFISELGVPVRDTSTAPKFIGEIIYNDDDSLCYIGIATSGNKWKQIGITPGSLGVTSVNVSASGALGATGGPVTSTGTITLAWQGSSGQYVKGNGTLSTFDTDVQLVGDDRYLAIDDFTDHSHVASDISNLTTTVRNLFSAGSGLEYDAGTGVFSYPGSGTEITTINGLTAAIQTFTGENISISSVGSGHTFTIDTATLLSTKAHTQHIADSLGALMGVGEVTQEQLDDTAAAIRADMDFNLIVESLGATGTPVFRDNNDSLYIRKIVAGPFVSVDTLATGEIQVSVDTASTDFHNYIALYGNDGNDGGGGMDSLEVVADDSEAVNNIWINSTLRRLTYRLDSFYYHVAITDSVRFIESGGVVYDTDAQAFFTAAGITDDTQKTAVNDLVLDLKAAGFWTNAKAIYPFVGGTATTHKWNLRNPVDTDGGFRLVFNGTWTHNSNGITGDGTSAYAQTFLIPSAQFTALNASFAYVSKTELNAGYELGASDGGGSMYASARATGNFNARVNGGNISGAVASSIGSFIGTTRTGPAQELYRNGSTVATAGTSDYRTAYPIYIGAFNNAGSAVNYSARNISFMMFYASSLSDAEAATLHTIMTDFNTALGR
jgi:hypothetical protein